MTTRVGPGRPSKRAAPAPAPLPVSLPDPRYTEAPQIMIRAEALAIIFGLTPAKIHDLARTGVIQKLGKNKFDLADCCAKYIAHWKARANMKGVGGRVDAGAETALLRRAQRQLVETKLAKAKGEVVSIAKIEELWSGVLRGFQAEALEIPDRLGVAIPELTNEQIAKAKDVINEMLINNPLVNVPIPDEEEDEETDESGDESDSELAA